LPIVEANSLRVLARLFGYRGDPRVGEGARWTWSAAERLLPKKRIGDFNQAMMELGALVCTPKTPQCGECPLRKDCVAFRKNLQSRIPPPKKEKETIAVEQVAIVIRRRGLLLLGKRPENAGRFAGFWEFPHGEIEVNETPREAAVRIAAKLAGVKIRLGESLMTLTHMITRHTITLTAMEATTRSKGRSEYYSELRWMKMSDAESLPISITQRKLLQETRP
jgi:A/G-specific adenine glycosylase